MKTTKEKIEIMQAYESGEQIEFIDCSREWKDTTNPIWDWARYNYRIKPKPKYVPFETPEEFFAAQRNHGEGLIGINDSRVLKANDIYVNIDGNVYKCIGNQFYCNLGDLKYLFINCKFSDGTPCGKEVEV